MKTGIKLETISKEILEGAKIGDLHSLRFRAIQIYNAKFKGNDEREAKFFKSGRVTATISRADLVDSFRDICREMKSRGLDPGPDQELDREAFLRTMKGIDVSALPRIMVSPGMFSIVGDFVVSPKTAKTVGVVLKGNEASLREDLVDAVVHEVMKETGKDAVVDFDPAGPSDNFIPVYDLVLIPRVETVKKTAGQDDSEFVVPYADLGKAPINEPWKASEEINKLDPGDERKLSAWATGGGEFDLLHHRVKDGKVVFRGLAAAMSKLSKSGGTNIPEADRRAVYAHLARHYKEFDRVPPAFKSQKADVREILKPYPNEHACRIRDPGGFDSFARKSRTSTEGKKYAVIYGIRREDGKRITEEQAYRYPISDWPESEARKHCSSHDGKTFEAAVSKTEFSFKILKVSEEMKLAGGIVYEPGKTDTQGDFTDDQEIEKMMIRFMEKYNNNTSRIKIEHQGSTYSFPIIESFVPEVPTKKGTETIPAGAWFLTIKITDESIWKLVKSKELTGFSMGGWARNESPS